MYEAKLQAMEANDRQCIRRPKIRNRKDKQIEQHYTGKQYNRTNEKVENQCPSIGIPERQHKNHHSRSSRRQHFSIGSSLNDSVEICEQDLVRVQALCKSLQNKVHVPRERPQRDTKNQDVRRRRSLSASAANEFVEAFLLRDENIRESGKQNNLTRESRPWSLLPPAATKVYLADPEFIAAPHQTSYSVATKNYTDSFFDHMRGRPVKRSSFLSSINNQRSSSMDRQPKRPSILIHNIDSHPDAKSRHGTCLSCSTLAPNDYIDTILENTDQKSELNVGYLSNNHTDVKFNFKALNDIKAFSSMDHEPKRPSTMKKSIGSVDSCGSLSSLSDDLVDAPFEDVNDSENSNLNCSFVKYSTENHTDSFFDHVGGRQVKRSSFLATLNDSQPLEQRLKRPSLLTMSVGSFGSCGSCPSFDEDFTGPVTQLQIPALPRDHSLKVLHIQFDRV